MSVFEQNIQFYNFNDECADLLIIGIIILAKPNICYVVTYDMP